MNYIPLGYNSIEEYRERTRKSKEAYWNKYTERLSSVVDTTRAHTLQDMTADLEILATALYDVTYSRENNPNLFTEADVRQNILIFRQTLNELNVYMERIEESSYDNNIYLDGDKNAVLDIVEAELY